MALAMPSVMVVEQFGFRTRMRRFRLRKLISDIVRTCEQAEYSQMRQFRTIQVLKDNIFELFLTRGHVVLHDNS